MSTPPRTRYPQHVDPAFQQYSPAELLGSLNEVERKNAPERLFIVGDMRLLESSSRVAVVGSRNATEEARMRARALTKALVEHGVVVVSGLAEGIDAEAHATALALGGKTIAVLGTPLDQCFPAAHRELQSRLMREQLVVSQFAPGSDVHPSNFLLRNRTMALLSDATVIVEAGLRSGTEHQGWESLRLGRLLFIMESLARRDDLPWVQKMMQYGAQVLSRANLDAVLANLPERRRDDALAF